jgi:DNA-binding CsgD family transcriptional regulator
MATLFRGRRYISPALADSLTDLPVGKGDPADVLSDREYEVMVSISSGKRIKDMADEMDLSIKTVSTYHSRILQKLRLDNDAQLIRYAIERGVVQDGVAARENLIVTDLKFKTATLLAAMREMWRLRKDVFFLIIAVSVLSYIILTYLVRFIL